MAKTTHFLLCFFAAIKEILCRGAQPPGGIFLTIFVRFFIYKN